LDLHGWNNLLVHIGRYVLNPVFFYSRHAVSYSVLHNYNIIMSLKQTKILGLDKKYYLFLALS